MATKFKKPAKSEDDIKAERYRAEARMGGTDAPPSPQILQEIADRKAAAMAEKAPTTKTTMGESFFSPMESKAKGGKISSASKRADGCATKGKTRGTMVTMKGGGYAC